MVKIIKKSIKYFIIIIGILIMIPTIFYLILQIPEVQTYLVKRITSHFSNEIKSTISIGSIKYTFFNRLSVNDLLIRDKHNDTLIYAQNVTAGLRKLDIKKSAFKFGKLVLTKPVIALITDSSGQMNLTWYLEMLKNPADTTKKTKPYFSVNQIDISNARFSILNHSSPAGVSKMDFNNLNVSSLNGIFEDFKIENDTTSFTIYNLSFREKNGLSVNKLSSEVKLSKQNFFLNSFYLNCESSILNIKKLAITADSSSSFKRFAKEVKLDMVLEKSLVSSSFLEYFIPSLNGINESVWLSGKIYGTVAELRGRDIELSYREHTYLSCDFDFSGLPKIENAFIYIGVNSLRTNVSDIDKFKIAEKENFVIPEVLFKLGDISFDGSFTGFITDFVTYGKIRTRLGNISTDISFRPEESKKYRINGLLTGSEINLGELAENPKLLGKLSFTTNVSGYAYTLNKFAANLTGKIDSVEINNYKYRNIELNGFFTEKTWDGSVKIKEENIKLDLLGILNFREDLPEFDFTMNLEKANLYKLNLDRKDSTSMLTMLLTSNFKGNSIDNLDGEIKLLNSTLREHGNNLELYNFSINAHKENNKPVLSLRTDFVDADIRGYYNFAGLGSLARSTLSTLMPSQFRTTPKKREPGKNKFTFEINFKNSDKINNFFRNGVLLADKSSIKGSVFADSIIHISGNTKSLAVKKIVFNDLSFDTNISGSAFSGDITSSSILLPTQSELKGFSLKLKTVPDSFILTVGWDNKEKILDMGNFIARGKFEKNPNGKRNAILTINIDSTDFYSRNSRWTISQSSLRLDSNALKVNKLYVSSKENYYLVNGSVSENPADTLILECKGIDISPLNYLSDQRRLSDTNIVPLKLKGRLNGKILFTNVYKNLLLEGNITVNNFSLLGSEFGDIFIGSEFDNARKVVNVKAGNNLHGIRNIDIKGYYDPVSKKTDMDIRTTRLPIDALNQLLRVFASDISGSASGRVNLSGEINNLFLTGAVMAENASMKVNYLQTRYKMNDTVRFDKNGIKFNNIKIFDEKGNTAVLSGSVNHKSFRDYSADLLVNMNAHDFEVLNTKPKDNELFYGTAFATGVTAIKSGPNSLAFDISAKSGKNSKLIIPLNKGLSISDYSFITFVDSTNNKKGVSGTEANNSILAPAKKTGIDINMDVEVNPNAEVQLIFDSKVGDAMIGHGSGNLNITLNRNGDFKMNGDYIIETGDYLFTLGNILNKKFTVENGGKIIFNGDIDNTDIDIKAIYKLRASLYDILQDDRFKERIPVECQLILTGRLFNPVVVFNIYLPLADEATRTYLRNAISTDEEVSRQFAYLLVMNSFYADPALGFSSGSASGTSAMAVTTTEMLFNQVSNWLSQISNNFDIGFVYRPGSGNKDINPQEVQVALSTQLLNNKVVINGNFDYQGVGSASNNTNQITGDFDAQYKLTEKVRFKVFNRANNPATGLSFGVPYTQGIGILFKQDFNRFSDLFHKKVMPDKKKMDTTAIKRKKVLP
jgi:hypothetical protein